MRKETFWVCATLWFVGSMFGYVLTYPYVDGGAAIPGLSNGTGDSLTIALLWPVFVGKYFILGLVSLFSNGYTLLTN